LDTEAVENLRQAATLHDIGKIAISDTLLLKPGWFTPEERTRMQEHVQAGASILDGSRSQVLRTAREIVLSHHEWWNGEGYPFGLSGEAIPLSGRIVAVADVFDALTHERPYKPAWSVGAALDEVDRLAGRQFDPRVVEAFHALQPGAWAG
jgi:putative two-component system response regulator